MKGYWKISKNLLYYSVWAKPQTVKLTFIALLDLADETAT